MAPRHILRSTDLSGIELQKLFWSAYELEKASEHTLAETTIAILFYEPSTRTMLSFASAVQRLGGNTIVTANAKEFSSAAKGENLQDTIQTIGCYADAIVLRHPDVGSAALAASVSTVPIINAGDGSNEHPTQAFLDLYTIWKALREGHLENRLRLVFFGDNAFSRTVRSLCLLLAEHSSTLSIALESVRFCGIHPYSEPPPEVKEALSKAHITTEYDDGALPENMDVLYVTRPQTERHQSGSVPASFMVPNYALALLNPKAIIMHPLPRVNELPRHFDDDPRMWIFKQVENGLYIRMALLEMLLC